jgi:hypothetical protein
MQHETEEDLTAEIAEDAEAEEEKRNTISNFKFEIF